ncbi:unnamed protein product [Thelazia callipaeda]|uniref:TDP43_N domain-containing protein n=1 Tax=Thelazia callipaeda TaxID=103827 RepID=A0A0N5D2G4_THECL|nr:unnamed protein product [Thelazia callipaeda]
MLRVHVQPVDIELDQESSILITTLQAALPGAVGLYYYDSDCKACVAFDGKKFLVPNGGWKERTYYAILGCRPFDYPFGSYANAAKQFECSVNTVQRLLASSKLFDWHTMEQDMIPPVRKERTLASAASKSENMQKMLAAITQRKSGSLEKTNIANGEQIVNDKQTILGEQFVEMAKIYATKDLVIEQQSNEIKAVREKLQLIERSNNYAKNELLKLQKDCTAKEEELAILRSICKDYKCSSDKINKLTKELFETKKADSNILRQSQEIFDQNEQSTCLKSSSTEANELVSQEKTRVFTMKELRETLSLIKARNEELENEINVTGEKFQQLNEVYSAVLAQNTILKSRLAELEHDASAKIIIKTESPEDISVVEESSCKDLFTLEKKLEASEKRIAELIHVIQLLTKDSCSNELRATHMMTVQDAIKCRADYPETKVQV